MIDLPVRGFHLFGNGDYISLNICEVFGYPNEASYGGGYGAKGLLEIQVGSYFVKAFHHFTTGELFKFLEQLKYCYETLSGEAFLSNTEREMSLKVLFEKTGSVVATGCFQEQHDVENKLMFELFTDQTAVLSVVRELTHVCQLFGHIN